MFTRTGLIVSALVALICVPCLAQDTDGDGISDEHEELLGTDPGSKKDVPAWCKKTGNEFIEMSEKDGVSTFYIRKKK